MFQTGGVRADVPGSLRWREGWPGSGGWEIVSELGCRNWGQGEDEDTLKIVSFSLCFWEPRPALVTNGCFSA